VVQKNKNKAYSGKKHKGQIRAERTNLNVNFQKRLLASKKLGENVKKHICFKNHRRGNIARGIQARYLARAWSQCHGRISFIDHLRLGPKNQFFKSTGYQTSDVLSMDEASMRRKAPLIGFVVLAKKLRRNPPQRRGLSSTNKITLIKMRSTTVVTILTAFILFAGCKKDNNPLTCGDQLSGKWRAYSFEIDGAQYLGYQGQNGFNFFEIEFSGFNPANNNGDLRITYQLFGEVPAPPITGIFSPSTNCDKLDTPAFLQSNGNIIRWDIISLSTTRLILEANPAGFTYRMKLDKI